MPTRSSPQCTLVGRRWSLPNVGAVSLFTVRDEHLDQVDRDWPAARDPEAWHATWRWRALVEGKPESFALALDDERVVGLWCTSKPLVQLEGIRYYRPDHLEIAPSLRGRGLGVLLFSVIAARALELEAGGIILGTWEMLRPFYIALGGSESKPKGWNLASNLVPFLFDSAALADLKAALDGIQVR